MSKLLSTLPLVILVVSLLAVSTYIANTQLNLFTKATGKNTGVSLDNSYVFASPLAAKANGEEKIRLTIFLLDNRGLGIANREIKIISNKTINLVPISSATDDTGKAVYEASSINPGEFEITSQTENETLPQKVKITFY